MSSGSLQVTDPDPSVSDYPVAIYGVVDLKPGLAVSPQSSTVVPSALLPLWTTSHPNASLSNP